jgi:hypothetical protein
VRFIIFIITNKNLIIIKIVTRDSDVDEAATETLICRTPGTPFCFRSYTNNNNNNNIIVQQEKELCCSFSVLMHKEN